MNLSFFIARRYFLSKRKKNFINVISIISMMVVGISTMALIIVVSVFNGLEDLLRSTYGSFDPDIVVSPVEGKSFELDKKMLTDIENIEGVAHVSQIIEDNVAIKYRNAERVIRMKGISPETMERNRLATKIISGDPYLKKDDIPYAIVGLGIRWELGIDINNDFSTIQLYYPKNLRPGTNPANMIEVRNILPGAIFAIEKNYDDNYVFVPVEFAEGLMNYQDRRTSLEIIAAENTNKENLKVELKILLGERFLVQSGDEIHSDLFKILMWEKLFVYLIFTLIIGIAAVNIYFVLTMLSIDKKKDMAILVAQGAPLQLIRRIFINEGAIISLTGAIVGGFLGILISLLQQEFGLISMGIESTLTDAYPIKVEWLDILYTTICIGIITLLVSIPPARVAYKKLSLQDL